MYRHLEGLTLEDAQNHFGKEPKKVMVSEQIVQEFIGSLWVNTATTLLVQVFVMPIIVWVVDCMKAKFAKPVKQLEQDSSLEQWPVQAQDINSTSYDDEPVEVGDVLARQSNNGG